MNTACKFWENQATCGQWHPPLSVPATVAQSNTGEVVVMILSLTLAVVCLAYLAWTIRSIKRREKRTR